MAYNSKVKLLVVEAFAGTYGVARQVPTINDDTKITGVSVGAYAGIEYQQHLFAKAERLTAVKNSLGAHNYFNVCGDLNEADTHTAVVRFVHQQLQNAATDGSIFDAVLVFGGLPCEAYSKTQLQRTAKYINGKNECHRQYSIAQTKHAYAAEAAAHPGSTGAELAKAQARQQQMERRLVETEDMYKLATALLDTWEKEHERRRVEADNLVQNFLNLYKSIEKECQELQACKPPACYLVMENVESIAEHNGYRIALWNREVMKPHLQCQPPIPSAMKLAESGQFVPAQDSAASCRLRCIKVNWCRYGHNKFSLKPTVIFTNLPTLQTTRCICKGKHAVTIAGIKKGSANASATARAAWPQGFVLRTIWLCAQHVRLASTPGSSVDGPEQAKAAVPNPPVMNAPSPDSVVRQAAEAAAAKRAKPPKASGAAATDTTLEAKVSTLIGKLPALHIKEHGSLSKAQDVMRNVYDICALAGGRELLCTQPAFVECLPYILQHHCAGIRHGAGDMVGKVVDNNSRNQSMVAANQDLLGALEECLTPGRNSKLRTAAAKIIQSLAANHPENQQGLGGDSQIIKRLTRMLKLTHTDAVHNALAALAALTAGCPTNMQRLRNMPGAQAMLVRLQADQTAEMKCIAVLADSLLAANV